MPTSLKKKAQARRNGPVRGLLLLPLGALALLGGCATNVDRMRTSSIPMQDYRNRHPIVLAEAAQKLDIFPPREMRGLDRHTYEQVAQYGALYRATGQGPIQVFIPAGGYGAADRSRIEWVRRALAAGGARAPLQVTNYPVVNGDLASPVRLSFVGLKSKVADPCGQWPADLASGGGLQGWDNTPYWNYGCAYQSMIAEQVADPRDLVEPRAEDPADTEMQARAIAQVRQGTDPTTNWRVKSTDISNIGSTQ
ncbi:CpaD family pilus assembly protein [uncultured Methylovirgula sp.]|uniref:CpaD family pilus assembly protein n=1 Tax=uncultured Methylovirgula sp. TaxID=1285960 RepID=UPI002628C1C6|nr:CpaD family pilus assembly protein [uncultured Methylovirgula sp.]